MTGQPLAYVVGAYEHPTRKAVGMTLAQLHADVAFGALADAGLSPKDIDGYFCASDAPAIGAFAMSENLGMHPGHFAMAETGGSAYVVLLKHAAEAIAAGRCSIALITMADNQFSAKLTPHLRGVADTAESPSAAFEAGYGMGAVAHYALAAQRHMYEFGTTAEQMAWVKVAMSHHAQHNPHALLQNVVTVEEVLASPMISDPLHRLDCCVNTDGGGAVILANREIARSLSRPRVAVLGLGEAIKHNAGGVVDLTYSAGRRSAALAFEGAGVTPKDIGYASLYDSFTITVIMQLEDVGFCEKGEGGAFAADGGLISGSGRLAVNTDGGGLCSNHPGGRGGMTKILEAVRQARGEAHPAVQVKDPSLVVAHGTGGSLGATHISATAIFGRE